MNQRFYSDSRIANLLVSIFSICTLLTIVPMSLSGTLGKLSVFFVPVGIILVAIWFGLARGTHVTIDDQGNLYGTLFFIRTKTTALSDVLALSTKKTFMGAMTEVYMTIRLKNGFLENRGVATKEGLKGNDFKALIEAIHSSSPNIKIPEELFK
jgi:hypothetical protein